MAIKRTATFKLPQWMLDQLRANAAAGRGSQAQQLEQAFKAYYETGKISDTDRLNWLADEDNKIATVQLSFKAVKGSTKSLRQAIDEAMGKE